MKRGGRKRGEGRYFSPSAFGVFRVWAEMIPKQGSETRHVGIIEYSVPVDRDALGRSFTKDNRPVGPSPKVLVIVRLHTHWSTSHVLRCDWPLLIAGKGTTLTYPFTPISSLLPLPLPLPTATSNLPVRSSTSYSLSAPFIPNSCWLLLLLFFLFVLIRPLPCCSLWW